MVPLSVRPPASPAPQGRWARLAESLRRRRAHAQLAADVVRALAPALREPGALVARPCPVCGGDDAAFVFRAPLLDFHRCGGCALVYAPRSPADELVDRLYRRSQLGHRWRALLDAEVAALDGRTTYDALVASMLAVLAGRGAVLDIGCGLGTLLAELRPHFTRAIGVEPNRELAERSRERFGLTVHDEKVERLGLPAASFDLVVLNGVLEHVAEPRPLLAEARRLLAPGGVVFVRIPNGRSLGLRVARARHAAVGTHVHLNMFGPRALRQLALVAGLQTRRLWTDDRWDLAPAELLPAGRVRSLVDPASKIAVALADRACAATGALSRRLLGQHLCALLDA